MTSLNRLDVLTCDTCKLEIKPDEQCYELRKVILDVEEMDFKQLCRHEQIGVFSGPNDPYLPVKIAIRFHTKCLIDLAGEEYTI